MDIRRGKPIIPKRIDKVIEELPKNDFKISKSALAAGYGKKYSISGTKHIKRGIEKRLTEIREQDPENKLIRGIWDRVELIGEYKKVMKQDKDFGSKLRAIAPLLQESGDLPRETGDSKTIPVLILNFGEKRENPLIKVENESPVQSQLEGKESDIEP